MYDAHGKAAGSGGRRRTSGSMHFSPSYGVRAGYIKDPNWPPAQMPDEGTAAQRRHLRVKCGFTIRVPGGQPLATTGDISAGGAKFTLNAAIGNEVEVLAADLVARATVLQVQQGTGSFTYRVKFDDAQAGAQVFESAFWAK